MGVTQYIGARYVPLFAEPAEWDSTRAYEPLTIVLHNGNSYTSKQAVPIGIDIDNDKFWVLSANYNAQVETYRKETAKAVDTADASLETAKDAVSKVEAETTRATDAEKVLTDNLAAEVTRATDAEKVLTDNLAAEVTRTTDAEKVLTDNLAAETTRATDAEKVLTDNLAAEVVRATDAEKVLTDNLAAEVAATKNLQNISMIAYGNTGNSAGIVGLYVTTDSTVFTKVANIKDTSGATISADTKNVFTDNENLYLLCSGTLYRAVDLLTFEKIGVVTNLFQQQIAFKEVWGMSGFYDNNSGKYYFYAACGSAGGYKGDMQIYYITCDSLKSLPTTATSHIIELSGFSNVIDPYVTTYNDGYIMAFKDETRRECWVATSTNPISFSVNKSLFSHAGRGFEGPQIININGQYSVWVDGYSIQAKDDNHLDPDKMVIPGVRFNGWFPLNASAKFNRISITRSEVYDYSKLRHPAFMVSNKITKKLGENITYNVLPYNQNEFDVVTTSTNWVAGDTYAVCNAPSLIRLSALNTSTLTYEGVFNENCIFGLEFASEQTARVVTFGSGFTAGNGHLKQENRFITFVFGNVNTAFPQVIAY